MGEISFKFLSGQIWGLCGLCDEQRTFGHLLSGENAQKFIEQHMICAAQRDMTWIDAMARAHEGRNRG